MTPLQQKKYEKWTELKFSCEAQASFFFIRGENAFDGLYCLESCRTLKSLSLWTDYFHPFRTHPLSSLIVQQM